MTELLQRATKVEEGAVASSLSPPPDRDFYTIPRRSKWFRWDEIHDTEREALPEFFGSASLSRNPRVYKEYRDFIINRYREDPSRRLTFTEVRKSLLGDVGTLRRVFAFLDSWGLINFSALAGKDEEPKDGGFPPVVVEDGPPGGLKVVPYPNSSKSVSPPSRSATKQQTRSSAAAAGFRMPPLTSYSDVFSSATGRVGLLCGYCGEKCATGSKMGGLIACTKCLKDENYKGIKTEDDIHFNNAESNDSLESHEWTDVETLHLLEALIAKRNDWALISDQAKRSRLDCITRLIQLPFGEHMLSTINNRSNGRKPINQSSTELNQQFLNRRENKPAKNIQNYSDIEMKEEIEQDYSEPSLKRRCFSSLPDASNSLLEQVSLVSAIVAPHIAASAAEAAISAICNENPYATKVFNTGSRSNSGLGSFTSNDLIECETHFVEDEGKEEHIKVEERSKNMGEKNFVHLMFQVRAAIATAFGAVAANAKLLADQEDREIELLVTSILENQIVKIQSKIKHFEELESIMEMEYAQMQEQKDSMLNEWVGILQKANDSGVLKWREQGFSKTVQGHTVL